MESGSGNLITGEARDMVLSVEDLPEGWEAHDRGQPGFVLCNNSVEFHFAPQGEYNEYLPKLRIIIAVYEGIVLENETTWDPIEQSEWIYESIRDGNPREIVPIDLGEEGYYTIYNSTINGEPFQTSAIYAFRAKNVWVKINFINLDVMDMPYWGWMEDIARLQESRILG